MPNVFEEKSAEKLQIQLSDGRMIPLKDLVRDYERLLTEESLKKATTSEPKCDKSIVSKLKVGEWFRIDRAVIDESREEICRKCNEAGMEGKALWERLKVSNKIADANPKQYPRLIETYICRPIWRDKTEKELRDICKAIGDGMCCEVICDLELQMRICNGEQVDDLVKEPDKLPRERVIKLRNGGTGYFGGGAIYNNFVVPAQLVRSRFYPKRVVYFDTAYAFRRV